MSLSKDPTLHVLVADDDPVSRYFFSDGLRQLGATVDTCTDGITAIRMAQHKSFHVLLLDCRMPGASANEVLTALRTHPDAASHDTPAVASSAEAVTLDYSGLLRAGFSHILIKPCTFQDLSKILILGHIENGTLPVLDDTSALQCSGDINTMQVLRSLLYHDLTRFEHELESLCLDRCALLERLHQLQASCGFCGATAMLECVNRVRSWLNRIPSQTAIPLALLRPTVKATLRALQAP